MLEIDGRMRAANNVVVSLGRLVDHAQDDEIRFELKAAQQQLKDVVTKLYDARNKVQDRLDRRRQETAP